MRFMAWPDPLPPPAPITGKQVKEEGVRIRRPIYDWAKEEERDEDTPV